MLCEASFDLSGCQLAHLGSDCPGSASTGAALGVGLEPATAGGGDSR